MATVTDFLVTTLKMDGLAQYIAQMNAATGAVARLAAAEVAVTEATAGLAFGINDIGNIYTVTALKGAAFVGGLIALLKPFADAERAALRSAASLQAFGSDLSFDELARFADGLQKVTAFDDDAIISLGALGAQFRLTREQILKTIPVVADLATRENKPLADVFESLVRATRGRTQGLISLGIDPKTLTNAKDLNRLLADIDRQVHGLAQADLGTLGGQFLSLVNQIGDALEAMGQALKPVFVPILKFLRDSAEGWELFFNRISGGGSPSLPNAATAKGDPQHTRLLGEIAENTRSIPDKLIQSILGGPGTVANRAGNLRDARIAWGV